jgi:glycosyltransferase involved in cell wall biosynthesis
MATTNAIGRPTVSVIIPAYNAAKYLDATLASVLGQTQPPMEVLVIDDGSTDDTPAVLERYGPPVRGIRQQNSGEGPSRNTGLAHAIGDYIAFLDADDVCAPTRFEQQTAALQRVPEAVACFTGHWTFDQTGPLQEFRGAALPDRTDSLDFLARCVLVAATVMFDRERAAGLRFPNVHNASGVDMIFSALLATRGRIISIPDPLYGYRSHSTQISIALRANTTTNPFFEFRHSWAKAHWQEFWPDRSWAEVERKLWSGLVQQTEDAYWARHKAFFLNDRNYLRRNWPSTLPAPEVLRWRWYPDAVWRLKNALDRARG